VVGKGVHQVLQLVFFTYIKLSLSGLLAYGAGVQLRVGTEHPDLGGVVLLDVV
jgi:hypothetical protein